MKRGQLVMTGLIYAFIELIMFIALYPVMMLFIGNITNDPAAPAGIKLIMTAYPIITGICVLATPIIYTMVARSGPPPQY